MILDWENYKQKQKPNKNQTKQSQTTTKKDELSVTLSFSIFSWSRDRIISINILIWQEKKWEAHSCHWPLAILKYCWIYILRMPVLGVGNVSSLSLYLPPFFSLFYHSKNLPIFELFKEGAFGLIDFLYFFKSISISLISTHYFHTLFNLDLSCSYCSFLCLKFWIIGFRPLSFLI